MGLSNSVSALVESLANAEEEKLEVISTEDLLYNVGGHDDKVKMMRIKMKRDMMRKLTCGGGVHETGKIKNEEDLDLIKELLENLIVEVVKEKFTGGEVPAGGPQEDEGLCGVALVPLTGQVGLLCGWEPDKKGSTTALEPKMEEEKLEMGMNDEELELDKKIEAEMIRIGEEAMKERLEAECEDCGGETEEMELCLLGLDVEALFPSMTSARTGEIVRRRMMKSKMKVEGFQWKVGLVYILMNKHLTTNLGKMWKILP